MKRGKHKRVTTTQQYVGEARRDKYWTQWAERRVQWNSHCACETPCEKFPGCKPK